MPRLCERPGCSAIADVAYGFDRVARTVWLDRVRSDDVNTAGALCRRHADAMVVPMGWVLDDRREPVPRLFRAPTDSTGPQRRPRRRTTPAVDTDHSGDATVYQLPLDRDRVPEADDAGAAVASVVSASASASASAAAVGESDATAWIPRFDTNDDLDGLLDARGPLLSRAFTGSPPAPPAQ